MQKLYSNHNLFIIFTFIMTAFLLNSGLIYLFIPISLGDSFFTKSKIFLDLQYIFANVYCHKKELTDVYAIKNSCLSNLGYYYSYFIYGRILLQILPLINIGNDLFIFYFGHFLILIFYLCSCNYN